MKPISLYGPNATHLSLGMTKGEVNFQRFPGGESYCQIGTNIRGADTFVVQSIASPANNGLMDLLVIGDAARRASAGRLTAVIPYMGYMRGDRKDKPRVPITAKLVVDMIETAGFDRIITMDVHTLQAQGFTNLPFDHLFSYPLVAEHLRKTRKKKNLKFVSPDIGAIKRAQAYAETFGVGFAIVNKKRLGPNEVKASALIGDVDGFDVVISDDLTESCKTLIEAAKICRQHGAKSVSVAVTHCCLHEDGVKNLLEALDAGILDEFITTNTLNNPIMGLRRRKLTFLKCDTLFGTAMKCINKNQSVTGLFEVKGF